MDEATLIPGTSCHHVRLSPYDRDTKGTGVAIEDAVKEFRERLIKLSQYEKNIDVIWHLVITRQE